MAFFCDCAVECEANHKVLSNAQNSGDFIEVYTAGTYQDIAMNAVPECPNLKANGCSEMPGARKSAEREVFAPVSTASWLPQWRRLTGSTAC